MNEKFIFDEIIGYLNATDSTGKYEQHVMLIKQALNEKERQDKILNILKEKKVDLMLITDLLQSKTDKEVKDYLSKYNKIVLGCEGIPLTEEEMQLLVDWLRKVENDTNNTKRFN